MPKRSNDFQKITLNIHRALATHGITVEESVLVPEKNSDTTREVDILLTTTVASHKVRVGIECRDHERKQDITWIDGLIGKYANLDIDRVIAVSHSPFTNPAKQKAAQHNIELLTLEEAERVDWASKIGPSLFRFFAFHNRPLLVGLFLGGNEVLKLEYSFEGHLVRSDPQSPSAAEYFQAYYQSQISATASHRIGEYVFNNWVEILRRGNEPAYWEITCDVPASKLQISEAAPSIEFDRIVWGIGTKFTASEASSERWVLGDRLAEIATGITPLDGAMQITLVSSKDGHLEGVHVSPLI